MEKKHKIYFITVVVILLPIWMLLFWFFTPKVKMVGAIVDKSVLEKGGQEHISLTWILNHKKMTKTSSEFYDIDDDYFGFFPKEDESYRLKGLERFTNKQLNKLAVDADFTYYAETYGVYRNEWFKKKGGKALYGKIYGGLSQKDLSFLKKMKNNNKLVIAEFNTMAAPTKPNVRLGFEKTFGVKWTGWTGRYFRDLDTLTNKELPKWLTNNYIKQYNNWTYKKAGIVFVHSSGKLLILEDSLHLKKDMPFIKTSKKERKKYNLPSEIKYSFWFDVLEVDVNNNRVVSSYYIDVNKLGKEKMNKHNLPYVFPAVTAYEGGDYRFFYFSGDFCDNPISMLSSYFKGNKYFKWLYYDKSKPTERKSFFWDFYQPLVNTILEDELDFIKE